MARLRTDVVRAEIRKLTAERASAAAGNRTLSRREARGLDPLLARAEAEVRAEAGKGARITGEAVGARAAAIADAVLDAYNPPGRGLDSAYLSKAERAEIRAADPAVGEVVDAAAVRALAPPLGAKKLVEAFFAGFDFRADDTTGQHPLHAPLPGATVFDARKLFPDTRAALPAKVLAAHDVYGRLGEADLGATTLQRASVAGQDVFVLFSTTDGDDGYLEVLDPTGAPITSARLQAGELLGFDEVFGRCRFSPRLVALDAPIATEGYSEPDEAAAAGQVPHDWPGDLALVQGRLHYDPESWRLTQIDAPALSGSPRRELGVAALEYLWEESLKHRVLGSQEPFKLGPLAEGTLTLGSFTRPTDGKTYEVADWRDIDDGSFTLYFDRTAEGRLKLAIAQFNN